MKRKLIFFAFFIIYGTNLYSQIQTQSFRIKGDKLQTLFASYDSLEAIISITSGSSGNPDVALATFYGYNGATATDIFDFTVRSTHIVQTFENVPLRCYGKTASGFTPKATKYYYLVPTRLLDLRSGKYYLCLRIKSADNESTEYPYYKSLNPVPPGPPGYLFY